MGIFLLADHNLSTKLSTICGQICEKRAFVDKLQVIISLAVNKTEQ